MKINKQIINNNKLLKYPDIINKKISVIMENKIYNMEKKNMHFLQRKDQTLQNKVSEQKSI